MNKSTIAVALAAGFIGGAISRYAAPTPVHAQQAAQSSTPVELRAQRFVLVNPDGGVMGTFTVEQPKRTDIPMPPSIRLLDWSGKEIWRAGGSPVRNLASK
jgi:hypothetical protein